MLSFVIIFLFFLLGRGGEGDRVLLRKLWTKMSEADWRTVAKAVYMFHTILQEISPEQHAVLKVFLGKVSASRPDEERSFLRFPVRWPCYCTTDVHPQSTEPNSVPKSKEQRPSTNSRKRPGATEDLSTSPLSSFSRRTCVGATMTISTTTQLDAMRR